MCNLITTCMFSSIMIPRNLNCRYHFAINRPILSSARLTAGYGFILLCLWCFEDNCSVIWCVFCWWKRIGPMHRHCCAYIAYVQSLYAEHVGRSRLCLSHDMCQVMTLTIYFQYDLSFCVALNTVQYYKMAPYVFWKLLVSYAFSFYPRPC
jgi:hypothetical protein